MSEIVITRTPFRLSFFGGGTDFPGFFNEHGGAVLGTTIDKYTYITANSLVRLLDKKIRLSYSEHESVDDPGELFHGIVRVVLSKYRNQMGDGFLDIHSFADLPSGTGIGSSSSFAVGFINAIHLLNKEFRSPDFLAKEAIDIERNELKEAGGWQDQIHAAFGGFNKITFRNNSFTVTPIYISQEKYEALEDSCMFFFTGLTRSSAQVHSSSASKISDDEKSEYLKKMYSMVDQAFGVLNETKDVKKMLQDFSYLLDQSWQFKKTLSNSVSNSRIDDIYDAALKAGALGGKLLGAGSGGFVVFIVPKDKQSSVRQALSELHLVPIKFESNGSRAIFAS